MVSIEAVFSSTHHTNNLNCGTTDQLTTILLAKPFAAEQASPYTHAGIHLHINITFSIIYACGHMDVTMCTCVLNSLYIQIQIISIRFTPFTYMAITIELPSVT